MEQCIRCADNGLCGGCTLQDMAGEKQIDYRVQLLKDAFRRSNVPEDEIGEVKVVAGKPWGYRSRLQLHDGGLLSRRSHTVIPIADCPIATTPIRDYLRTTPCDKRPRGRVLLFGNEHIVGDEKLVICADLHRDMNSQDASPTIGKGRHKKIKVARAKRYFTGTLPDSPYKVTLDIGGTNIAFDARGFFQSNIELLPQVADIMRCTLGDKNMVLLDIYSGVGTFSALLKGCYERTILVEHNRDALVYAEENLTGTAHSSLGVTGSAFVKDHWNSIAHDIDKDVVVLLDPPREGIETPVLEWLCALIATGRVRKLLLLSCNLWTQGRDCALLMKAGYRLKELYLLDFYPQTALVESLCILEVDK